MLAAVIGVPELIIILVILLLLFGARRLPDIARSLGKSVKELRKGLESDEKTEEEAEADSDEKS